MKQPRRNLHIRRWLAAFVLAVLLVLPSGDRLHITPALDVASEHVFSLVQWHITNFFGKWGHLLREAVPGQKPLRDERLAIIDEYLQTSRLAEKEERLIEGRIARAGGASSAKGAVISREYFDELLDLQRGLRPKAEEGVESELSAVLLTQGFGWWGNVLFPPVDIRFGHLPTIIVTSRRDKIARLERLLLRPELEYIERGRLEDALLEEHDLSAIVGNLAGLSTYPTLVADTDSLRSVLRTAAHECCTSTGSSDRSARHSGYRRRWRRSTRRQPTSREGSWATRRSRGWGATSPRMHDAICHRRTATHDSPG